MSLKSRAFEKIRTILKQDTQTVLLIENAGNFIDSARNSGCSTTINALLGDIKNGRYQCILETPYSDLGKVIKCDSDIRSKVARFMLEHPEQKGMLCMEYNPDTRDVVLKSISLGHERAQTPANDIHPAGKLSSDMTRAATL